MASEAVKLVSASGPSADPVKAQAWCGKDTGAVREFGVPRNFADQIKAAVIHPSHRPHIENGGCPKPVRIRRRAEALRWL